MRVLITGVTSFTGSHFARALLAADHEVWAMQRRPLTTRSDPLIQWRLRDIIDRLHLLPPGDFTSSGLHTAIAQISRMDALCLHGAHTTDHQSADFDWRQAFAANIAGMEPALDSLHATGCRHLLISCSIFEATEQRTAASPYGLAKTLTTQAWRHAAKSRGWSVGRFIIPHPFGVHEKRGLTSHIVQAWLAGRTPELRQPSLTRDFVFVDELARAYEATLGKLFAGGDPVITPSGFAEPNGVFAERLGQKLAPILKRHCRFRTPDRSLPTTEPNCLINNNKLYDLIKPIDKENLWRDYVSFHEKAKELSIYS